MIRSSTEKGKKVAWIEERLCIGCAKCSKICPVDAIIGTLRTVHTVVSNLCTGCDLCVTSCPTNCIKMLSVSNRDKHDETNKIRYEAKLARSEREKAIIVQQQEQYKATVLAAITRVKSRKSAGTSISWRDPSD